MNIINVNKHVLGISVLLASGQIFAQVDNEMLTQQHDHSFMQPMVKHEPPSHEISSSEHMNEHGGEIYQSSEFTSKWLNDDTGQGVWQTQLESRIGTDENKLFVQLNAEKTESENTNYDTKFMYSRAMADFWDIQAGIRYIRDAEKVEEKNQTYAAFGLNGLAPYFFDRVMKSPKTSCHILMFHTVMKKVINRPTGKMNQLLKRNGYMALVFSLTFNNSNHVIEINSMVHFFIYSLVFLNSQKM